MRTLLALALLTIAPASFGQQYEKVLVPLPLGDTPGAYGSLWSTRLVVTNLSDTPVDVQTFAQQCGISVPCPPSPPIPPQGTVYLSNMPVSEVPAAFLFVEQGRRKDVSITLRTADVSRLDRTWGVTIPVLTRDQLFAGRFGLGDVPVSNNFRSTLRIYDFDATTAAAVRVRIYKVTGVGPGTLQPAIPDELLADFTPQFQTPTEGGGVAGHPGYTSIPLWLLPQLAGVERVRILIEPLDATADYWAFVSSTHNDTQHVTVFAPQ